MIEHLKIKIFGRVQGVFFRYEALKKAKELNIKGFVKNENDGSLYLEAEGEKENLKKFLKWCRRGPILARVEKIQFEFNKEIKNFSEFKILK